MFNSIGSHKPMSAPTESRMSAMRAMPETTKGLCNHCAAERHGSSHSMIHIAHPNIRRPMGRYAVLQQCVPQLIDRADVLIAQAQAGKTSAIGWLLVRGPAEQIFVKRFCTSGVGCSQIDPTEASGIYFAELHHGSHFSSYISQGRDAAGCSTAAYRDHAAAVIGSMMVRTSVTLLAGKPLSLACS